MSLIVYGVPLSPYVRKLRLCLAEKNLDYQMETVLPFNQPSWFRDINPLGRIPAIKDGDFQLADSSVICQYIEEKHRNLTPMLGHNAEQAAQVRWLEKYADYELAPLTTFTIFQNRVLNPSMKQPVDESAVALALSEKLPPLFDYLERTLGSSEYFVGETLSLADLAFASQMVNMEHGEEHLDEQRWPHLAGLYSRIKARPSLQDVLPGELKMLAAMKR